MIALVKYAVSILIWGAVAAVFLITGNIVYLTFWSILGAILIVFWLGHMLYHFFCLFNPDFKPINVVIIMAAVVLAGLIYFKIVLSPRWNTWGSTKDEIGEKYEVDHYCDKADLRTVRTVEVNVPRDYIFKWIRQLPSAGSYGEGLFLFRNSDRFKKLADDLPKLRKGDQFLIGKVVDVDEGKSITFDIGSDSRFPKMGINCMYGGYYFHDIGHNKTRINMVMRADYEGIAGWFYSQVIVEIGDFFVTTKQLGMIKKSAEEQFSGSKK